MGLGIMLMWITAIMIATPIGIVLITLGTIALALYKEGKPFHIMIGLTLVLMGQVVGAYPIYYGLYTIKHWPF